MTDPSVSIVVVNYNGGNALTACLEALQEHSDCEFEVIVVDNASTDGSASRLVARYPRVRLIESAVNCGYSGAVNLGARYARGTYLAVLNMDVVAGPRWLSPLIRVLEADPAVGAVTPRVLLRSSPGRINALGQDIHVTGLAFNRRLDEPAGAGGSAPSRVNGLHGSAFVMRLATFARLGGMSELHFMYHEDVELSLRLAAGGYLIAVVPASVVYHSYELHMTAEKLEWLERNRWLTLAATYRTGTLVALAPMLLLTELMVLGYASTRGRAFLRAKARAVRSAVSHGAELDRLRRTRAPLHRVADRDVLRTLRWSYDWSQFGTLARQPGGWLRESLLGLLARRTPDGAPPARARLDRTRDLLHHLPEPAPDTGARV